MAAIRRGRVEPSGVVPTSEGERSGRKLRPLFRLDSGETGANMMTPVSTSVHEARVFGMVLGRVVVQLRTRRDWTQAQLADRLGISQSAVSKIEAGKHRLDAFHYGLLAAVLDMDVQRLDERVRDVMARTRAAVAAVTPETSVGEWGELLPLAGFGGIIEFVVALRPAS